MKKALFAVALASVLPFAAQAESTFVSPAPANASASARVDFRITVPRVLYLQVGTGTNFASNTAIDLIDFTVPAATMGNGVPIAATAASGDRTNGAVTIRVLGNGGNISLNSATGGPLGNGAGQTVGWGQINVAAAALPSGTTAGFTNGAIVHPAFNTGASGGGGTATTLTATAGVVRQEGQWTYSYLNQNPLAAGTYGGVDTNNGRVSYTATMP